jgi:hypothetical protein
MDADGSVPPALAERIDELCVEVEGVLGEISAAAPL